jgi:hypothetical protein
MYLSLAIVIYRKLYKTDMPIPVNSLSIQIIGEKFARVSTSSLRCSLRFPKMLTSGFHQRFSRPLHLDIFTLITFHFKLTICPLHCVKLIINNTTGVTSGERTACSSGAPEFTPSFLWGSCCSIFSFRLSAI